MFWWCPSVPVPSLGPSFGVRIPPSSEGTSRCEGFAINPNATVFLTDMAEPSAAFSSLLYFVPLIWSSMRCDRIRFDVYSLFQLLALAMASFSYLLFHWHLFAGWYYLSTIAVFILQSTVCTSVLSMAWHVQPRGRLLSVLCSVCTLLLCSVDIILNVPLGTAGDNSWLAQVVIGMMLLLTAIWFLHALGPAAVDTEACFVFALWLGRWFFMMPLPFYQHTVFRRVFQHVWTASWACVALPWSHSLRSAAHKALHSEQYSDNTLYVQRSSLYPCVSWRDTPSEANAEPLPVGSGMQQMYKDILQYHRAGSAQRIGQTNLVIGCIYYTAFLLLLFVNWWIVSPEPSLEMVDDMMLINLHGMIGMLTMDSVTFQLTLYGSNATAIGRYNVILIALLLIAMAERTNNRQAIHRSFVRLVFCFVPFPILVWRLLYPRTGKQHPRSSDSPPARGRGRGLDMTESKNPFTLPNW